MEIEFTIVEIIAIVAIFLAVTAIATERGMFKRFSKRPGPGSVALYYKNIEIDLGDDGNVEKIRTEDSTGRVIFRKERNQPTTSKYKWIIEEDNQQ